MTIKEVKQMSEIAENRQLVVPGEVLAEGMDYLPGDGAYRNQKNILSSTLGLVEFKGRLVKVIPLNGKYMPKKDDPVIGIVKEVGYNKWTLDLNGPYDAFMLVGDASDRYIDTNRDKLASIFGVGDAVICQIKKIDENLAVFVTARGPGLRKLHEGRIIHVKAAKIPRIIGKSASMVKMIKEFTGTRMFVGQNGIIWVDGGDEALAVEAVRKIEAEAHVPGLTDRMKAFLSEKTGKTFEEIEASRPSETPSTGARGFQPPVREAREFRENAGPSGEDDLFQGESE